VDSIITTDNHPWLTADRGWVLAGDLRREDVTFRACPDCQPSDE
jgi:hypothetical protein